MVIGDTSARNKANGVPFIETTKFLQSQHFCGFEIPTASLLCPQSPQLMCGLRTVAFHISADVSL
jgi:hypothetical protein